MPQLLHVLNVEKHIADNGTTTNTTTLDSLLSGDGGAQNWGTVAVYSCPDSCEMNSEEFVIVQDAVDGGFSTRRGDGVMVSEVQMDEETVTGEAAQDDDDDDDDGFDDEDDWDEEDCA